jgi:hypothetical protein
MDGKAIVNRCRSLLIGRFASGDAPAAMPRRSVLPRRPTGDAQRRAAAGKFLFFPRGSRSDWCTHRFRSGVALQHLLVNINENTSVAFAAGGRTAAEPTELPHKNSAHRPVRCNTRGRKTSQTTSDIQAGTRGRGTCGGAFGRPHQTAHGCSPLSPAALVNRCRSLLIAHFASEGLREPLSSLLRHPEARPRPWAGGASKGGSRLGAFFHPSRLGLRPSTSG